MLADLCEKVGANVEQVAWGIGLDKRVGPELLRAGLGFGGFRLPQDIHSMILLGDRIDVNCSMLKAAERINTRRIDLFIEKVRSALWVIDHKIVGVLGVAYKPDTDDISFSPAFELLRRLRAMGAVVRAFDPRANNNARQAFADVSYMNDAYEIAAGADALLIATEWSEFRRLDWSRIHRVMGRPLLLAHRVHSEPFGQPQLAIDRGRIERVRLPHLQFVGGGGGTEVRAHQPGFARVPLPGLRFRPCRWS